MSGKEFSEIHRTSERVCRGDFGMDRYLSLVSDEVRLVISVEAIREE